MMSATFIVILNLIIKSDGISDGKLDWSLNVGEHFNKIDPNNEHSSISSEDDHIPDLENTNA